MTTTTMAGMGPLIVGQVAESLGVTVRTLHHYDEVGLLRPSGRTPAGYRLYDDADLQRLQHIVVYRRLGFSLEETAELLADMRDNGADAALTHLRRQRAAVMSRLEQMQDLVRAIDKAMERTMTNEPATTQDLKDLFGGGYRDDYQAEAEQRWGDTPQWRQSKERQATMTRQDWADIKAETAALERDLGKAVASGAAADSEVGAQLAERHRASIERHYDCPYDFQVKLARNYVDDDRFREHYEQIQPGAAQWLHDAIVANAAAHG